MLTEISRRLLEWYVQSARVLPWRGYSDPYPVWVSEIMLQQTRVETVIPYFERWMQRFPGLAELAAAPEQDVLRLWEGLGYYSRARNIHQAACQVMSESGGMIPHKLAELEKLPGVGRYTAAAIASISFGQDEAALDGNIRRVLARVFNLELPARSPEGEKRLWELAQENLPPGRAGDYNQAVMDLGALICTPRSPDCKSCPLSDVCQANLLSLQNKRPVLFSRPAIPHYVVAAAIIRRDGVILIAQRPAEGLLGGLWEFPGGKQESGESLPACLRREICEELGVEIEVIETAGVYRHAYTHFRVTLHAFECKLVGEVEPRAIQVSALRWVGVEDFKDYPMGKIDRLIASSLKA